MGKIIVLGLAVGASLWMVYNFIPEMAHTAFSIGKFGITWTMLLGAALFVGYNKLLKK